MILYNIFSYGLTRLFTVLDLIWFQVLPAERVYFVSLTMRTEYDISFLSYQLKLRSHVHPTINISVYLDDSLLEGR